MVKAILMMLLVVLCSCARAEQETIDVLKLYCRVRVTSGSDNIDVQGSSPSAIIFVIRRHMLTSTKKTFLEAGVYSESGNFLTMFFDPLVSELAISMALNTKERQEPLQAPSSRIETVAINRITGRIEIFTKLAFGGNFAFTTETGTCEPYEQAISNRRF